MFFEETLFAIRLPETVFDNIVGATEQCCHVVTAKLKELTPELSDVPRRNIKGFCKEKCHEIHADVFLEAGYEVPG